MVHYQETLTGFKWMSNRAYDTELANPTLPESRRRTVLLAFEESIGFMCGTTVLDKDGVTAAVRAAELMAHARGERRGGTLQDLLEGLYERYGYHCNRGDYFAVVDRGRMEAGFSRLRNFQGRPDTVSNEGTVAIYF